MSWSQVQTFDEWKLESSIAFHMSFRETDFLYLNFEFKKTHKTLLCLQIVCFLTLNGLSGSTVVCAQGPTQLNVDWVYFARWGCRAWCQESYFLCWIMRHHLGVGPLGPLENAVLFGHVELNQWDYLHQHQILFYFH